MQKKLKQKRMQEENKKKDKTKLREKDEEDENKKDEQIKKMNKSKMINNNTSNKSPIEEKQTALILTYCVLELDPDVGTSFCKICSKLRIWPN